jgi:hypothetical protein
MNLNETYADALNNLLWTLKTIKGSGTMVEGIPSDLYFNFAMSEIKGLLQGFQTKDECINCSDCCIKPPAIVPKKGIDGGVIRPLQYELKYRRQPCWWLRQDKEGYKCSLHDTGEKPFTCFSFQCESRGRLEEIISNTEKQEVRQ